MDSRMFQREWPVIRRHAPIVFKRLTVNDMDEIDGQQEEMVRLLIERYNWSFDQAQGQIDETYNN